MNIRVCTIGKLRSSNFRAGADDYLARIEKKHTIDLVEVEAEKISPKPNAADINKALEKEASRLEKFFSSQRTLIALSPKGKTFDSLTFSKWLAGQGQSGKNEMIFLIGGAYGLHDTILKKATLQMSLSPLTFSHELALVVLLEQLYRGFSILEGAPYHK